MLQLLSVIWDVNPVFFRIGPLEIRYYGLAWAFAFGIGMWLFARIIKREGLPEKVFDAIFWYGALSAIIGSRLGHVLFYDPGYYFEHPLEILNLRHGGMASHGAAIGLLTGLWLFSRKTKLPYVWGLDRMMLPVCIGGAAVRLGNLMNSEIYGIETDLPWGFVFVRAGETLPMHPTQIYEAICYTLLFVLLMWLYFGKDAGRRRPGLMSGIGITGIFLSRFFIEFIKNPQEAFEADMSLYMGQWLSIPFVFIGIGFIVRSLRGKPKPVDHGIKTASGAAKGHVAKRKK